MGCYSLSGLSNFTLSDDQLCKITFGTGNGSYLLDYRGLVTYSIMEQISWIAYLRLSSYYRAKNKTRENMKRSLQQKIIQICNDKNLAKGEYT